MLGAGSILVGAFIGAGIGALSTTVMKAGEEISTGNVRSAKEAFRDVGISAASGFITGAFGAKFPGAHRLVEGVVDTAVSAGERFLYAVFDDSMSWDEKWAYAFYPGQMVADFVIGVVIGEILDGIMAATQNKLRSIFANYDAAMREALESGSSSLQDIANKAAQEYNAKYNPYERAINKGYTDVKKTANGGVSFQGSEYMYYHNGQEARKVIQATGNRNNDFKMANQAMGLLETLDGYVWHHLDDYNVEKNTITMELVMDEAHNASKPHSGGYAQYDSVNGPTYNKKRR